MEMRVFHHDCVACLAKSSNGTPEEETVILITMMQTGHDPIILYRDLCFMHRRCVDNAVKRIEDEQRKAKI